MKNILITGGSGFIGTNLINFFLKKYPNYNFINIDCLNYASNTYNINFKYNNYTFFKENINNYQLLNYIFKKYNINCIINLAAQTHVDNSIQNPTFFAENNILGTINLLNVAKENWNNNNNIFFQISTDEVFGSLNQGSFTEKSPYNPQSPYSASKASSDHFVKAFANTYNIKYIITFCSNNYGPFQHKEKLIPKTISNILNNKKIPIYFNGHNIRNWIYVTDHILAIDTILHNSKVNQIYNIATEVEISNLELIKLICKIMQDKLKLKNLYNLICFTEDRPGHDFRYSIKYDKLLNLGWRPSIKLKEGLIKTINWYINEKK